MKEIIRYYFLGATFVIPFFGILYLIIEVKSAAILAFIFLCLLTFAGLCVFFGIAFEQSGIDKYIYGWYNSLRNLVQRVKARK